MSMWMLKTRRWKEVEDDDVEELDDEDGVVMDVADVDVQTARFEDEGPSAATRGHTWRGSAQQGGVTRFCTVAAQHGLACQGPRPLSARRCSVRAVSSAGEHRPYKPRVAGSIPAPPIPHRSEESTTAPSGGRMPSKPRPSSRRSVATSTFPDAAHSTAADVKFTATERPSPAAMRS
jgi:hypothetical protein